MTAASVFLISLLIVVSLPFAPSGLNHTNMIFFIILLALFLFPLLFFLTQPAFLRFILNCLLGFFAFGEDLVSPVHCENPVHFQLQLEFEAVSLLLLLVSICMYQQIVNSHDSGFLQGLTLSGCLLFLWSIILLIL